MSDKGFEGASKIELPKAEVAEAIESGNRDKALEKVRTSSHINYPISISWNGLNGSKILRTVNDEQALIDVINHAVDDVQRRGEINFKWDS